MDTQFSEIRDLLMKLTSGKVRSETIPLEDSANSNDGETEEEKEKIKGLKKPNLLNPPHPTPHPKVGSPGTMRFLFCTLPTHLSLILA